VRRRLPLDWIGIVILKGKGAYLPLDAQLQHLPRAADEKTGEGHLRVRERRVARRGRAGRGWMTDHTAKTQNPSITPQPPNPTHT